MTSDQAKAYATKLLGHWPFVYCPTLAAKTSNHTPHKGDIVLFYSGGTYVHTGLVYKVDSSRFYTVEGNTSGASGIVSNGGGVATKAYYTSSYTSSKFYRPDYSILVSAGIFASTDAAINAVIAKAKYYVGYCEKSSNAQLESFTANSGSNNYTIFWKYVEPSYQGQPWCACYISFVLWKAIESGASGTTTTTTNTASTSSSNNASTSSGTTYAAVKAKLSAYGAPKQWTNGSTDEPVYADSAMKTKIGTLDPYDSAALIGKQGAKYIVAYNVSGSDNCKVGFVDYAGKASISSNVVKVWKNGSTDEPVYADTVLSKSIGSLDPKESCSCLGTLNGKHIVLYKVDGTSYYKVGVVAYSGGL